jgi:hypothetical protein
VFVQKKTCFWKLEEKVFVDIFNESITCVFLLYAINYINYKCYFHSSKQEVQRDNFSVSVKPQDLAGSICRSNSCGTSRHRRGIPPATSNS